MSRERARRREVREAAQAELDSRRRSERARAKRRKRRREAARSVAETPRRWADRWQGNGIIARRNRRRLAAAVGVIAAVQILLWPFLPGWGARLGVLAGCILLAPIGWVLAFGRV